MPADDFLLVAGTSHPDLAADVAAELGIALFPRRIDRFPDGEVSITLLESVRRQEVVLFQPTAPPVDTSLVELLALADACRRAAASRITAIIPYFGYARSDRRSGGRTPIAASLVARLIEAAGIDQVLTVDLHSPQIEGFFRIPLDTCSAVSALCAELADRLAPETVVVSPDTGRIAMAEEYARCLGGTVAVTHKRRESGRRTRVLSVAGDVKNRPCLIIDDMIATGETISNCAQALLDAGSQPGIAVAATHGLMLEDAWDRLESPALSTLVLSDTVPVVVPAPWRARTIVASVACPLARSIERILCGEVVAGGDRPATA